ncbi:MAG: GldG family protein [Clostridia bacterium]|nr:GldG family protein [Clostridia bacterium]
MKKFFGKIKNGMKKLFELITNKWLLKGTTTVVLVALVIAGYVGINMLAKNLEIDDLDFTTKKLYSLTEATKSKLKSLEDEITIQLINMKEYTQATDYIQKYENATDKITIEKIEDITTRVDLQTKYEITGTDMLVVVKNGETEKVLTVDDLYTYDYSTYETIDTVEEAVTNAIMEVTIEEKPHIYVLTGKTYYAPEQILSAVLYQLESEANELDQLDILSKGNVPEDCDCLVITTLKQDLSELERDKILEYINKGGKILMLSSQNILEVDTPNLDQVLAQYGISLGYGAIFEQDTSKMLSGSPELIITDAVASYMSDIDMSLQMCLVDAGKIEFADKTKLEELGVTYETIATTSEKAFVRTNFETNTTSRTDKDSEEGSSIVAARVDKKISDETTSELIIFSSELMASNMQVLIGGQYYIYAIQLYNNEDVILNSISHLTERTDTITIRKTDEVQYYTVSDQEDVMIKTIIFVVPVLIIGAGVVVWAVRRRSI